MRDLFICPRNVMRDNWAEACPKAKLYSDVGSIPKKGNDEAIVWIHCDPGNVAEVFASIGQVLSRLERCKVIMLSNTPDQAEAFQAMSAGVVGYCHALSPPRFLREVRAVVAHGGIWLGAELLKSLMLASKPLVGNAPQTVADNLALLTKREREVALEAAKGLSNKEIARVLDITERTVKAHLSASFERLGLKDRLQLALMLNERTHS